MPFFWAITAGCCSALAGVISKQAEQRQCRPEAFSLLFLGTVTAVFAVMWTIIGGRWGQPQLWLLAVIMGGLYLIVMRSMIPANQSFSPSLVWTIANVSLVIPVSLAPLLLHEYWRAMDWAIVATFAALLYTCWRSVNPCKNTSAVRQWSGLPALSAVFLGNGLLMFGYKLKETLWPDTGTAPFALMIFSSGFFCELLLYFRSGGAVGIQSAEWKWGIFLGIATAAATLCLLGAVSLPAVVVFPVIQGIGLGGGILLIFMLFRESLNVWKIISGALAMTILFLTFIR
jgi:drug/metabolite transporter (DMT)-like permease